LVEFFFAGVASFMKFIEYLKVIQLLGDFVVGIRPDFFGANALQNSFCLPWVIPKISLM
jgi:hypothetical protein